MTSLLMMIGGTVSQDRNLAQLSKVNERLCAFGLDQGWANFLAQGLHSEVEFICGPHYSNL